MKSHYMGELHLRQMSEPTQNPLTPYERLKRGPSPRAVFAILAGVFLFLVVPGIFALFYALFAELSLPGRLLFLALAAVSLFMPVWAACVMVRRKLKTGRWRPSPEEWMQLRVKAADRKVSPRLTQGLAALNVLLAGAYIFQALKDPRSYANLLFALIWSSAAAHSIWQLYRNTCKPSAA